jgi:endonuclease YncB( thermonuclease family)
MSILRWLTLLLLVMALASTGASSSLAQKASCDDFASWESAQLLYERDPSAYASLDVQGDGIACPELPRGGFAPAYWSPDLPTEVEEVQLLRILQADTFEVVSGEGNSAFVRLARVMTPAVREESQCGGQEAVEFVTQALATNDHPEGQLYLERDGEERDEEGLALVYLWWEIDGQPYLLNEVLLQSGWGAIAPIGNLPAYDDPLRRAAAFAELYWLGAWDLCGGFPTPLDGSPDVELPPTVPTPEPDIPPSVPGPEPPPPPWP